MLASPLSAGVRAARVVSGFAGLAATVALLWWCRPAGLAGPDAAVVRAAAWAAWAVVGYLAAGSAAFLAARLVDRKGRTAGAIAALLPVTVRRAVDLLVGTSVVLGAGSAVSATAAAADDGGAVSAGRHPSVAATIAALDWAGHPARPERVTVRAGDSLWAIAARSLGPHATDPAVAATWPRWWAGNRSVIGPDPDLLRPGQRLQPPTDSAGGPHARPDR